MSSRRRACAGAGRGARSTRRATTWPSSARTRRVRRSEGGRRRHRVGCRDEPHAAGRVGRVRGAGRHGAGVRRRVGARCEPGPAGHLGRRRAGHRGDARALLPAPGDVRRGRADALASRAAAEPGARCRAARRAPPCRGGSCRSSGDRGGLDRLRAAVRPGPWRGDRAAGAASRLRGSSSPHCWCATRAGRGSCPRARRATSSTISRSVAPATGASVGVRIGVRLAVGLTAVAVGWNAEGTLADGLVRGVPEAAAVLGCYAALGRVLSLR